MGNSSIKSIRERERDCDLAIREASNLILDDAWYTLLARHSMPFRMGLIVTLAGP